MEKSGTIFLYYRQGDLATARKYKSLAHRHEIIAYWKKMYAAAYGQTYLQILPETNCLKINGRGLNTTKVY